MEVDDRRTPEDELGPLVGSGRDATIHALGPDRVLRRTPDERDHTVEAAVMEHVRLAGYPVPRVHRVGPGELVLDRVDGPTMLDDLAAHPWRIDAHARTLARLHERLHTIEAPPGLRHHPVAGTVVLHQDLHPGNVMLAAAGPVVIDWTNACQGAPSADVALSWVLMASFDLDEEPPTGSLARRLLTGLERRATPLVRRRMVATFLRASGVADDARAVLGATARARLADRAVRPGEATAIRALVAREAPSPDRGGAP